MTRTRVRYRREWEAEFTRQRPAFRDVAEAIKEETAAELERTGLVDDPPAREYLDELDTASTDTGARVFTTASRAHLVEFGTIYRDPDAPMRTAARRFGRFVER